MTDVTNKNRKAINRTEPNNNGFITNNPASPNPTISENEAANVSPTEERLYGGVNTQFGGIGRSNPAVLYQAFNRTPGSFLSSSNNDLSSISSFLIGRDDLSGDDLADELNAANVNNIDALNNAIALASAAIGNEINYNPDFKLGDVNFTYQRTTSNLGSNRAGSTVQLVGDKYKHDISGEEAPTIPVFPQRRNAGFGSTYQGMGENNVLTALLAKYNLQ